MAKLFLLQIVQTLDQLQAESLHHRALMPYAILHKTQTSIKVEIVLDHELKDGLLAIKTKGTI